MLILTVCIPLLLGDLGAVDLTALGRRFRRNRTTKL